MGSTYHDLPELTGQLKRAAIDAWMKDQQYTIQGDRYHYDPDASVNDYVTRPGANGEGGGDYTDDFVHGSDDAEMDRRFAGSFASIRQTVDNTLQRWHGVPDPGSFDLPIESMRQANIALAATTTTTDGETNGAGEIGANLKLIDVNSTAMAGGVITAFKSKFLLNLGNTIGGLHGATAILGAAQAAEQKLWEKARQDLVNTVETATRAFNAHAASKGAGTDWDLVFGVTGAVIAGATAFATGGATVALSGAAAGLSLLKEVKAGADRHAAQPKEPSYESIMKAFTDTLENLHQSIKAQEESLADNLTTNYGHVFGDPGYDLAHPLQGVDDDSDLSTATSKAIIINKSLVFEITDTAMPAIADELVHAKNKVQDSGNISPFWRDGDVGVAYTGAFPQWSPLMWLLFDLLGDLEWEVRNGAKTLELAVKDIGQADTSAEDALERQAKSLADGSGYDLGGQYGPTDPHPPPPKVPPGGHHPPFAE